MKKKVNGYKASDFNHFNHFPVNKLIDYCVSLIAAHNYAINKTINQLRTIKLKRPDLAT